MIRNFLKTAYRTLLKNKGFTVLNILGLSAGLATCLLIVFYVVDELSYDKFNTKASHIYRITENARLNGNEQSYAGTEKPLLYAIKDMPEIEKQARFIPVNTLFLSSQKFRMRKGNNNIQEKQVVFTDSRTFDIFTLPAISGKPALDEPHTAVITQSAAQKYFNHTNAVGQVLTVNDTSLYKITAVIKDIPSQSHFNYDFFLSYSSIPESGRGGWGYSGIHNYLLLKPGANIKKLESEMQAIAYKHYPPSMHTNGNYLSYTLTPLLNLHLHSVSQYELSEKGSMQYVYIFSVIAAFILLIACVNFMNLSTARSSNRAREVGVRKVLGSARKYLIFQFLAESFLVTLVSAIIAVVLAWALLPFFNQLAVKHLAFTAGSMAWLLPALLFGVLAIGFLAGSYPAFFLSAFRPIDVLKGKLSAGFKGSFLRSFLVVFQFSISIFLIIGTLVIYNQLQFIHNKDLGFNRDQMLVVKNTAVLGPRAKILRQEIRQMPGVLNATMSTYLPTGDERNITGLFPSVPIDIKQDVLSDFWPVDENYIGTLGIHLIAGRNFSAQISSDSSALIVNEAFIKRFGFKDALNKTVYRFSFGLQAFHIIGVVKDFNFSSLRDQIKPVAMVYNEDYGAITARVKTASLPALLSQIESKWKGLSPGQQLSYSFMDQDFDATYRAEQRIGRLFISFSTLAILIACLGLFGLAAYAAEQRNKEIGIRKVLGATVSTIVGMLSMDFIKLVFIAILIASPLAWFVMHKWLQDFAYRVNIQWYILASAGIVAIFIAFMTISFQSVKAALANPADSLRSE
ncbi:ABC transporter permease [Mucilaginibacter sp. UR6-11]|uniref:ABC transporter permease n=1 Tax=Mucilaginibacter sp. UR6-11 TaxID=1435644 RepID=UPI001E5A5BA8|nr:ABC transporter permease [Mucilaginibacter sp. UR6-11]MCC8426441.1 ABC transporter permease [Mucilaginibacter sp. UR6-11]